MPTVVKKSNTFRDAIPRALQGLYDFATDDPMGGLAPAASVVSKAPKSLVAALRGLHKAMPVGKEVADEILDVSAIEKAAEPFGERMALFARVTPSIPPPGAAVKVPEFAKHALELPDRVISRTPELRAARQAHFRFRKAIGLPIRGGLTMPSSRLGAEIRSEIRRGVVTPRVKDISDIPVVAQSAPKTEAVGKKPLIGTAGIKASPKSAAAVARGKLTENKVREIRSLAASGEALDTLAKKFGTDKGNIRAIINRESWNWVK